MANIILTNPKFFTGGESSASYVVGFDSGVNRVVRYSFEPPSIGANRIELSFLRNWTGGGTLPNTLRFFIGTDPNSHINAGVGYEYTGELARKQGTYEYYGSADVVILPNRTYYAFVFPTTKSYGWVQWSNSEGDATAEAFGGAFSVVSPQTLTIGAPSTIFVTKYNEPYTHTIRYSIGTASGVICEKESSAEVTWTPNVDLVRQITDSETGLATLTVESYSGDTLIGTAPDVQFTLKVPENITPSVTATFEDLSSGFDLFGVFVQNISFLKVNSDATGAYGSKIKSVAVYLGGNPYNGGVVTESGEIVLSVVATDTRGRTGEHNQTIFFHEYYPPTISVSASRCDENGSPDETGEFAIIKMATKSYQVNDRNTARIVLNYGNSTKEISVQVGETAVSKIVSAPSVSSLRISAVLIDRVSQSAPSEMVLGVGYATMDFLAGGKGIAFGTTAIAPGFECAMPAKFTSGVSGSGLGVESADHPGCYYRTVDGNKEWINPPMVSGLEYLTPNRWNGKPVYSKLIDFGLLPKTTVKGVSASSESVDVVSIYGRAYSASEVNSFPVVFSTGIVAYSYISAGTSGISLFVRTLQDMSAYSAQFIINYTKD